MSRICGVMKVSPSSPNVSSGEFPTFSDRRPSETSQSSAATNSWLCHRLARRGLPLPWYLHMTSTKKKQRVAHEMEQRSVSDAHVDKHSVSPIATGATAAMIAQQSGLMPIAVTLFTLLSAATFWRNVPPCSEAAKSLVDIKFEQSVFESMPPPSNSPRGRATRPTGARPKSGLGTCGSLRFTGPTPFSKQWQRTLPPQLRRVQLRLRDAKRRSQPSTSSSRPHADGGLTTRYAAISSCCHPSLCHSCRLTPPRLSPADTSLQDAS